MTKGPFGYRQLDMGIEQHTVNLGGGCIPFSLKRQRVKRINMRINTKGELTVSAPPSVELSRIKETLEKKEKWILKYLHHFKEILELDPLDGVEFRGTRYRVVFNQSKKENSISISPGSGEIEITGPVIGTKEQRGLLEKQLKKMAKAFLTRRISEISKAVQIPYSSVSIRNQKTRWGSSSSLGSINLNWRIIMAPDRVIDYLIIHELAHQIHHNHSTSYWQAVEKLCPEYKKFDKWLKKNGYILSLFRSS